MSRRYLGLDFQEDTLCAVVLQSGLKHRYVESCAQVPLPSPGSLPEKLLAGLTALSEKIMIESNATVLSIPIDNVTCRNIRVPFTETKKIRQVLPFELEPHLPVPIENLVIDFQKIDTPGEDTQLITVATNAADLTSILEAVSTHHIDPEAMVPGAYAVAWRLLKNDNFPENWILLEINQQRCHLLVTLNRKLALMRSFPLTPLADDAPVTIARHIQQTMAGMDAMLNDTYLPEGIFVTGTVTENDSICQRLTELFEISVQKLNLFDLSNLNTTIEASYSLNNALACALMAAAGSNGAINLRRGPLARQSHLVEYKSTIVQTCIFAALALIIALTMTLVDNYTLEKKANQIKKQTHALFKSALPNIQKIVDPVHQLSIEIDEIKKKAHVTDGDEKYLPAIDIIYHLSREIPGTLDVRFSKLVAGDQSILLSGTTDSFNAVNEMKRLLENNALFKIVKINSANMERTGKRVRFKIKIQL